MQFLENEVRALTAAVCESVLLLPVEEVADPAADAAFERPVAARVQISGAWEGAVSLKCPTSFATRAAGIMFGRSPEETTPADLQDAVGELANMIGGNIKALLPEPCKLSLPEPLAAKADSSHCGCPVLGGRTVSDVTMNCCGDALRVSICAAESSAV